MKGLARVVNQINRQNGWDVLRPSDWEGDEGGLRDPEQMDRPQLVAEVVRLRELLLRYRIPAALALIHSEVTEALEAFRVGDREGFDEELADILIRLLDTAGGLGVDLDEQVHLKLEKNRTRGHRHGGKRV